MMEVNILIIKGCHQPWGGEKKKNTKEEESI